MYAKGLIILLCVLVAISDGARKPKCFLQKCPKTLKPVCGTDGKTYGNECLLCAANKASKKKIKIKKNGQCYKHLLE